jgi:hypothetical protein
LGFLSEIKEKNGIKQILCSQIQCSGDESTILMGVKNNLENEKFFYYFYLGRAFCLLFPSWYQDKPFLSEAHQTMR